MAELEKAAVESSQKFGYTGRTLKSWMEWEKAAVSDITPINPLVDFVKRIQDAGISVNVMTARSQRAQRATMNIVKDLGIRPDKIMFRPLDELNVVGPDFLGGIDFAKINLESEYELMKSDTLKIGMIRRTMDRYNYLAFLDDSGSNLKAGFKLGIPLGIQPSPSDVLPEQGIARGLILGQQNLSEGQMARGVQNLEAFIDLTRASREDIASSLIEQINSAGGASGARTGIMAPGTFRKLVESMEVAQNILKGRF